MTLKIIAKPKLVYQIVDDHPYPSWGPSHESLKIVICENEDEQSIKDIFEILTGKKWTGEEANANSTKD